MWHRVGSFVAFLAVLVGVLVLPATAASASTQYVVDTVSNTPDVQQGDGVCATTANQCSLRAALMEDLADHVPTLITFDIPGAGPHQIPVQNHSLTVGDIAGGTVIDGYTQPGASPNTDPTVLNAAIMIELVGSGSSGDVLTVTAANNVIRGLSIYNAAFPIRLLGAADNRIVGNIIGTDASGTFVMTASTGASGASVFVGQGAARNHIGAPTPEDRNVISGGGGRGVGLFDAGTVDNVVQNNVIGLRPDGSAGLRNRTHGVDLESGASRNVIGGTGPYERNVISGNGWSGVEVSGGPTTRANSIVGNYVGSDAHGTAAPGYAANGLANIVNDGGVESTRVAQNVVVNNAKGGIKLLNGARGGRVERNFIGVLPSGLVAGNGPFGVSAEGGARDATVGPGNVISGNATGVRIVGDTTQRITVTQNSIFANAGLGIDLSPTGTVNQNDAGDVDGGPNGRLNFPVITVATSTTVVGSACAGCRVELFVADSTSTSPSDPASYGEGATYLASTTAAGDGSFTIPLAGGTPGQGLTTTATDVAGNTSEFSRNVLVA